jgi:hypothetical protein
MARDGRGGEAGPSVPLSSATDQGLSPETMEPRLRTLIDALADLLVADLLRSPPRR